MNQHVITVQLKIGILDSKNGYSHRTPGHRTLHGTKTQNEFIKFSKFYPMPVYYFGVIGEKKNSNVHIYTHKDREGSEEEEEEEEIEVQVDCLQLI